MKRTLLLMLMGGSGFFGFAQQKSYWKPVGENVAAKNLFTKEFKPASYKLYQLQEDILRTDLKKVPMEKTLKLSASSSIVTVPDANGNLKSFRVVEAPVMQPALAAKYPNLKSFVGQGIDDPAATIRFDLTPSGFHAMVTSAKEPAYYVNPVDQKSGIYIVNPRDEKDQSFFKCEVDGLLTGKGETAKTTQHNGNADDGTLRNYRLALCVNGEYSQYFLDGTEADTTEMISKVMASLVTNLTRANEVYERDYGVRMKFVDKQDSLVFLDPETDPWPTKPPLLGSSWNKKTQATIDERIGNENYDIGHLLGKVPAFKDNNGNAGCIACVCTKGNKGSGFTAYFEPSLLDYMVIDYWAHEMGHQFGANHTFSFNNEGTGANVEPGSGSTIMGYAGITGGTDVQPHSDPYFHAVSIAQVTNYIKSKNGGCSVNEATENIAPVVDAGKSYVIPATTPFTLTGKAKDKDASDVLTYSWEQIDVFESGSNTYPNITSKTGPVFRSLYNFDNPSRTFPDLETLREGVDANKWEALPAVTRDLNFRLTVRDNHPGGGNNMSADVKITVDADAGPFLITSQAEPGIEWKSGEKQTITWDVANTDKGDINVKKVNILLSLDGGQNFRVVLAQNTDNDGEEIITVPEVITDSARIKVEAVDNIFFDISDADFSVQTVLPVTWLSLKAQALENGAVIVKWSTVNEINSHHFVVERSLDGINFQAVGMVNAGNTPSRIQDYNFSDFKAVAGANYYRIQQTDTDGKGSYSAIAKVTVSSGIVSWSIQPNPAVNATVVLAKKDLTNVQIQLTNTSGKVVYSVRKAKLNAGEQFTIPVTNLAKGVYVIKLTSDEQNSSEKLMVQ